MGLSQGGKGGRYWTSDELTEYKQDGCENGASGSLYVEDQDYLYLNNL